MCQVTAALLTALPAGAGRLEAQVSGRLQVMDVGGHPATDLGDAVVYIVRGPRSPASSHTMDMSLDARQFRPRVIVVPVGTTVNFPNLDPFNHNVFSSDSNNIFDLGLYGRGAAENHRFTHAGLVRVYCNIHPRMSGFVVVRDNGWFAQPGADGSFTIPSVPPGNYTLKAWHERGGETTQEIVVPAGGLANVDVRMDAATYQYVQHKNKYGQEYGSGSTRERY
ncbi:MAG TPA: carboxypeptidase regulatory-like domain-containing protein [Gemmatimonadales bacterium]